jgi:hypothetical protein
MKKRTRIKQLKGNSTGYPRNLAKVIHQNGYRLNDEGYQKLHEIRGWDYSYLFNLSRVLLDSRYQMTNQPFISAKYIALAADSGEDIQVPVSKEAQRIADIQKAYNDGEYGRGLLSKIMVDLICQTSKNTHMTFQVLILRSTGAISTLRALKKP